MDKEQIKKIIDSPPEYDFSKAAIYPSLVREFHSKKFRLIAIIVYAHLAFFLALAILCGILFWRAAETKSQIMYAAFFICCILIAYLIKVFAWVMGSRHLISREIKRLELRIVELSEMIKSKNG